MDRDFSYITTLEYRVKSLQHQVEAFRCADPYRSMQAEFRKQLTAQKGTIKRLSAELCAAHRQVVTVRQHWWEVFDDLEKEHRQELKEKERQIKVMEERALRAERQRDEALDRLSMKRGELYEAWSQLEEEKGKNQKLTAQINRDYENSSNPSSQKELHKKIHNSREKSTKCAGGQPGHPGHKRKKLGANQEPIFIPAPSHVTCNPDFYPTGKTIRKQLIDLKVVVTATDYCALEYRKRSTGTRYHAPFPFGVCNEVNYGASTKALAFLLNNYCNVSVEKTQAFLWDATDGVIKLSTGMINGLGKVFSVKTEAERKRIFASMLQAPVIYSDATVGRVNGDGKAVIVCTSNYETLYFFRNHKGHEGLKGTPVEEYQQTLVHDHDRTYYQYGNHHQECLAHVLRYLKDSMANEPGLTWNKQMHAFLQRMIHEVKAMDRQVPEDCCLAYEQEYDQILRKAQEEYVYEPPSVYYKEGYNLQGRLRKYRNEHLFFLRHPEVEYTNNRSERYCRKYKRKQKQAVTFRSQSNAEAFCDALSIIETGTLHGKSAYDTIRSVFEG